MSYVAVATELMCSVYIVLCVCVIMYTVSQQEISTMTSTVHEMHDSIGLKQVQLNSLTKYALQLKIMKDSLRTMLFFCISRSFKVIRVGTSGNLLCTASYDKQQV